MQGLVKDVAPLNNLATRMGEVRGAARRALKGRGAEVWMWGFRALGSRVQDLRFVGYSVSS